MSKTVLVTGASTGIGFDSVRALIESEFQVVATVRKNEDADYLKKIYRDKVHVLILDVRDDEQIENLPNVLSSLSIDKLDGLLNNAGVAFAAPFLNQPFAEIQNMIQVNVLSVFKITQVLLPLLGAVENSNHKGRIVNISSVAGQSTVPFLSVYAASKHAIEGFSEGLRKELMLFGIKVIVIGPGSIKTPIWNKGFTNAKEKYNQTVYSNSFDKFISIVSLEEKNGLDASAVSQLVVEAFTSENPCRRYAPIPRKWQNYYLPKLIPANILDKITAKLLGLKSMS